MNEGEMKEYKVVKKEYAPSKPMRRHRSDQSSRRRAFLITLFTCLSSARATELRQHRVRKAQRTVDYRHVREERTRGLFQKFLRRDGTVAYVTEPPASPLLEYDDNELFWHMQVAAFDPQQQQQQQQQSLPREDGLFRRLYDQFIGSEENTVVGPANSTNVTVELGNTTSSNNESSFVYTGPDEEVQTKYQPLRIRGILAQGNGNLLLAEERDALFREMLSPALLSWSSSLRVDPVVGNLTVDVNQLVDRETCGPGIDSGLPSIQVPLSHLTEGIPDTDMIVYLSVGFVVPRDVINGTNVTSATLDLDQGWNRRLPRDKEKDVVTPVYDAAEPAAGDTEALNTTEDFLNGTDIGNATTAPGVNLCTGRHLAAASFCSTDQYDRPTAALLHICIDETFFDPDKRQRNIKTLTHELGHALGFNSLSMAHFRKPDGTPYTPRVDGDIPDTYVECTGPSVDRLWANVALPSEEILRFREVRGGVRVAELVTPSVLQVVRNQFDCQPLTGAELESGEGLPLSVSPDAHGCIGDHWERRLFSSDLMNPVVDDIEYSTRISTLTLAYFADSGWYQVDLSNAEVAAGWGRGAGCNFAHDTCIGKNGEVSPQNAPFFCNEVPTELSRSVATDIHGCTPDLSRKAVCSMGQYDLDLPSEYQYFHDTYGSDVGGADALMDYCPVYSGFDNGACANIESRDFVEVDGVETFGVRNSRCLIGSRGTRFSRTALCLPIACVIEDRSLRIKVDRTWNLCEEADQEIVGGDLTVICPDPRRICPTFYCPYDCLGTGGRCDYRSGKCLCDYPGIDDEILWQVCRVQEDDESSGKGSFRPILRPVEPENLGSVIPHPDSPFADYYVPTKRALDELEDEPLPPWAIALSAVGGFVFLVVAVWCLQKFCSDKFLSLFRSEDGLGNDGVVINRDKDKMVASVLFDMRIRANEDSIAETDEQLTESEVASGVRGSSISDFSSRRSSEFSEVDVSQDEITEEDIRQLRGEEEDFQELTEEPWIIRRRKITAGCKKNAMELNS
jgi:hypothetical protein